MHSVTNWPEAITLVAAFAAWAFVMWVVFRKL